MSWPPAPRNGDEACKRYLWETLIDDLTDYRDIRRVLDYLHEHARP
jgi:hypothetical protein